jgi:hypothetical protein
MIDIPRLRRAHCSAAVPAAWMCSSEACATAAVASTAVCCASPVAPSLAARLASSSAALSARPTISRSDATLKAGATSHAFRIGDRMTGWRALLPAGQPPPDNVSRLKDCRRVPIRHHPCRTLFVPHRHRCHRHLPIMTKIPEAGLPAGADRAPTSTLAPSLEGLHQTHIILMHMSELRSRAAPRTSVGDAWARVSDRCWGEVKKRCMSVRGCR